MSELVCEKQALEVDVGCTVKLLEACRARWRPPHAANPPLGLGFPLRPASADCRGRCWTTCNTATCFLKTFFKTTSHALEALCRKGGISSITLTALEPVRRSLARVLDISLSECGAEGVIDPGLETAYRTITSTLA